MDLQTYINFCEQKSIVFYKDAFLRYLKKKFNDKIPVSVNLSEELDNFLAEEVLSKIP